MNRNKQELPFVPEWIAKRIDYFIEKKNSHQKDCFPISRQNIYILPSKSGWLFIISLIAILSGAINYNNNMAYLLCFFLTSLGFIAMLQTHQNINHLTIKPLHSNAVFLGQDIDFNFLITTNKPLQHIAIETQINHNIFSVAIDKPAEIKITESSEHRGYQKASRFKLFSDFPLGLFHAWTQVQLNNTAIVYPKPIPHNVMTTDFFDGKNQQSRHLGDDEFSGIRDFRKGDNLKSLAWKTIAKTNKLYTKEFHTETGDNLVFDFNKLNHINDLEEKLSILCSLIINASSKNINFGLVLPDKTIKPNNSNSHKHQCLTLLALYQ